MWKAGNRAKAAAPPPRPAAAATTRRRRRRPERATKSVGGTQCARLAASFGQHSVHSTQTRFAPLNPPDIHIFVPCAPRTLTHLTARPKARLPSPGGLLPVVPRQGRPCLKGCGQAVLPGGSVRRPCPRRFHEPGGVAGGQRGTPLAAAGDGERPTPGGRRGRKRRKSSAL